MNNLAVITQDIYNARESFAAVLTDQSISFEKEAGFAIQVLQNNDYTLKVATGNRQSVINAVTNVAAIGISLNPAKRQAYLVPRDGRICLDISYMGLIDLAVATGSIRWAQAELVRSADTFALNGFDAPPTHVFNPFQQRTGAKSSGAYVVVNDRRRRLPDHANEPGRNRRDHEPVPVGEVRKVVALEDRLRRDGQKDGGEARLQILAEERPPVGGDPPPEHRRRRRPGHHRQRAGRSRPAAAPAQAVDAARDAAALEKVWKDGLAEVRATRDMAIYNTFKSAVAARGAVLRGEAVPTEPPPDDGKTIDEPPRDPSDDGFGRDDQGGIQE